MKRATLSTLSTCVIPERSAMKATQATFFKIVTYFIMCMTLIFDILGDSCKFAAATAIEEFPRRIPKRDNIRMDEGHVVEDGRLELLGGISNFARDPFGVWNTSGAVPLREFRRILQCAKVEPGLAHHGSLSLLKEVPMTRDTILTAAAFAEHPNRCIDIHGRTNLASCTRLALDLLSGKIVASDLNPNPNVRLIRVISGRLYYDWPFFHGDPSLSSFLTRRYEYESQWNFLRLLGAVLEKVSDMPDSVFLAVSFDYPLYTPNFPVIALTHGPKITSPELPYPWSLLFNDEVVNYQLEHQGEYRGKDVHTDVAKHTLPKLSPYNDTLWAMRENKGAHFGTLWFTTHGVSRQVVLDLARKYPDLLDSKWTKLLGPSSYKPRMSQNPDEHDSGHYEKDDNVTSSKMEKIISLNDYMTRYKYLVVLAGQSTSGRLATFFAHSGAVVLMQETDLVYHFSPRLKPWIHYVPLSYSAADIVEKIQWLKSHDDMARQIAKNGYAFGRSFLRLEDYYCYAAAALEAASRTSELSAFKADKPILLPPSRNAK